MLTSTNLRLQIRCLLKLLYKFILKCKQVGYASLYWRGMYFTPFAHIDNMVPEVFYSSLSFVKFVSLTFASFCNVLIAYVFCMQRNMEDSSDLLELISNKTTRRISKQWLQWNKACQLLICDVLWDSPFCLITEKLRRILLIDFIIVQFHGKLIIIPKVSVRFKFSLQRLGCCLFAIMYPFLKQMRLYWTTELNK